MPANNLTSDQSDFVQTYAPLAQDVARATGLDASVVLGQIAQETGWGKHVLGNNIFGISPTGPDGRQTVTAYPDVATAANDYVRLIRSRYGGAASQQTPDAQAAELARSGYNPNPDYGPNVARLASQVRPAIPGIPAPGRPADADMAAQWGVAPPSPNAATAVPAAPPRPSDADLAKSWGIAPATPANDASIPTVTVTAKAPQATAAPNTAVAAPTPDYTGWDQPTPAAAAAKNYGTLVPGNTNNPLSYQGLSSALAPAPNTTYGSILPIARDNATGELRLALPQGWRDLAQGAVDLAYGPTLGTVTPQATGTLSTAAGSLTRSPAVGTGQAIADPLAYRPELPLLSQEFRANPGVTEPQFQPETVGAESPNPLTSNAPSNALNRTGPPVATTAPPSMTPEETAIYNAIPDKLPPAPVLPPLTQSSAEARADQLIRHFASREGSPKPQNLVPGYTPTLAQITNDPGIATLERGVQSVNPGPFGLLNERNQARILKFTSDLTGTPEDVAAAEAMRDASTSSLRDAAFASKADVDASPVNRLINEVLTGPDGKRGAVSKTLGDVQKSLHVGGDPSAPLESDPEMLYGVRKHINDLLSPVAQRENSELQQAAGQLSQVKAALDDTIESGAPGFKDYVTEFARQSEPIDAMKYLQGLNLTDAAGNVRLQAVDTAIKGIERMQKMPGVQKATSVSDDQLAALKTLRDTLRVQQFSSTAGKHLGSNTFQNLATNSRVGAATGNPLISLGLAGAGSMAGGPLGAVAGAGVNMAAHRVLGNAEAMVKQAMMERLLNLQGKGVAALPGSAAP